MNEESDRRRSVRHDARVRCQAVRERDFKLLGETSLDLSSGGMLALEFHSLDAATRARVRAALAASVPEQTGAGRVIASDPFSMEFGCGAPDDAYGTFALVM